MNSDLKDIIELFCAIFGVMATILGVIWSIIKFLNQKRNSQKIKTNSYYVTRGVFSDRTKSFSELQNAINNGKQIINVFGRRGIGKSAFLRFFCDSANKKLNRSNRKKGHKIKIIKGIALYIELSSYGNVPIINQMINAVSDETVTISKYIENLLLKAKHKKKIYIVLDNVNTNALSKEIESVVDILFSHSSKFCIIVGSIEKQPFINSVNESIIEYIPLNVFDEKDIFDFAEKNDCDISCEMMQKVLTFSDGLPIFVSLLLKNQVKNICLESERIDKYIERIYDDLSIQNKQIALYIAFLSITNAVIKLTVLYNFIYPNKNNLEELKNSSLIEYDSINANVKMHELFRNYIVKNHSEQTEIIGNIYNYYDKNDKLFEKAYYLLMLNYENKNHEIISAIKNAIKSENFSFLLLLGEHYKLLYNWENSCTIIETNVFLNLIYGYVSGLIGVGDYPAARNVIDNCRISANEPKSLLQFEFSLLTAHLYHLQNDYDLSKETYHILLNNITENISFKKYEAKCLWGIAHSLRHEGYDIDGALFFYDESIEVAIKLQRESEVLKSMIEKLNILIFQQKSEQARILHTEIVTRVNKLPISMYKGTRNSFWKLEARYVRLMLKTNNEFQFNLLQKTLNAYKEQKKRLQYNTYFELGEFYRKSKKYKNAKENYNNALTFSKQNYDYNLRTLSQIALVVNEISTGEYLAEELLPQIIETLQESKFHHLYVNELLSDMILSFLQNNSPDGHVLSELLRLNYISAINVCINNSYVDYRNLDLFLM